MLFRSSPSPTSSASLGPGTMPQDNRVCWPERMPAAPMAEEHQDPLPLSVHVHAPTWSNPLPHNRFYFDSATFQVENALFKLPLYMLTTGSPLFRDLFLLPQSDGSMEGQTDDHPIQLEEIEKRDFEEFVDILYPQTMQWTESKPRDRIQWISILHLSTMWDFRDLRKRSITQIENTLHELDPLEKIHLAKRFSVRHWFIQAMDELVRRRDIPPEKECERLGWSTAWRVLAEREQCRIKGHRGSHTVCVKTHADALQAAFAPEIRSMQFHHAPN